MVFQAAQSVTQFVLHRQLCYTKQKQIEWKPLLFDNSFNILENTLFWASAPAESGLTYRVRCRRHIIKHENTTLQIWDISEHINHKLSDGTAKPDTGEKWNYIICIRNIRLCAEQGVSVFWVCLDRSVSVWGIWCADQSWDVLNWPMCEGCTIKSKSQFPSHVLQLLW